jgi:glycosyltransferase involved in cell wall biosynthesis
MRILHIIPSLDVGGAESVTYSLANGLTSKGHSVSLLTESTVPANKMMGNIEYKTVENPLKNWRIGGFLGIILWGLRHKSFFSKFDIVHCHLNRGMILGLILSFSNPNKRPVVIATCHSVGGNISNLKIAFEKFCSTRFDAFILMATNDDWSRFGKKKWSKNLQYIQNGIIGLPRPTGEIKRKTSKIVVGTLSRLSADRKPELFLNLFKEISILNNQIDFVIGGAGVLKEQLENAAKSLDLDSIQWLGEVTKKPEFFQEIDLYITLVVGETSGIAGLEAVSVGLPVFGIQLLEKYNEVEDSFIYSSSNLKILANKIVESISNPRALDELKEHQSRVFNSQFTFQIMLQKYETLYKTLLQQDVRTN